MQVSRQCNLPSVGLAVLLLAAPGVAWSAHAAPSPWVDKVLSVPYPDTSPPDQPRLQLLYQDFERLGLRGAWASSSAGARWRRARCRATPRPSARPSPPTCRSASACSGPTTSCPRR